MDPHGDIVEEFFRAGMKRKCDLWLMSPDLRYLLDRSRRDPGSCFRGEHALHGPNPANRLNGDGRILSAFKTVMARLNVLF